MKFQINYGNGVLCLPRAVLSLLDRADEGAIKVLLHIASGEGSSVSHMAQTLSMESDAVKEAIAFWRGAGLIMSEGSEAKGSAAPTRVTVPAPETEPVKKPTPAPTTLPRYTTEELSALLEQRAELSDLVDECSRTFGKIFNTMEVSTLLGMVDYLSLDGEYLLLLLAHCVKMGKKSVRYAEKLAFSLYDEGITDLAALQERLKRQEQMADVEGKIRTLFGISSRALTTKEKKLIDAWLSDMKYGMDVITRAYEITVDAIGKSSIPYTNSILERWATAGLRTLAEIEEAERQRAEAGKTPQEAGNSFDTDEFFGAALSRSFGGDFTPVNTKAAPPSKRKTK